MKYYWVLKCFQVIIKKSFGEIVKEVNRSDRLWCFSCDDICWLLLSKRDKYASKQQVTSKRKSKFGATCIFDFDNIAYLGARFKVLNYLKLFDKSSLKTLHSKLNNPKEIFQFYKNTFILVKILIYNFYWSMSSASLISISTAGALRIGSPGDPSVHQSVHLAFEYLSLYMFRCTVNQTCQCFVWKN